MAVPTIPDSARGVSTQRSGPNSSNRPRVARNTPPKRPTSSPSTTTRGSRRISKRSASLTASMMFISGIVGRQPSAGATYGSPALPSSRGDVRPSKRGGRLAQSIAAGLAHGLTVGHGDEAQVGDGRQVGQRLAQRRPVLDQEEADDAGDAQPLADAARDVLEEGAPEAGGIGARVADGVAEQQRLAARDAHLVRQLAAAQIAQRVQPHAHR